MKLRNETYTTRHEIRFLNGLGTFRPPEKQAVSKRQLIQNYIKSAANRDDWGAINKELVLKHAKSILSFA